jgi:16S rRNA processing protein RimM
VKPHGLAGEVAVEILTDFPDRFVPGLALTLRSPDGALRSSRIDTVRPHGGRLLVRFDGVPDVDAAEELRGADLCVRPDETVPRPEGFVYHFELEGCRAVDREERDLGVVRELLDVGGRALLVLATPAGDRDVPFTHPIVVSVDVVKKRVVLDPPEGLLD